MKLALLGVTVLVSSGDDGAPGFSFTCPSDPSRPVLGQTCPIKEGCGCSDFVLHKVVKGHDRCGGSRVGGRGLMLPLTGA
jgi:hypothetical protein